MKKIFFEKRWSIVVTVLLLFVLSGGAFLSCQNSDSLESQNTTNVEGVEYPIPEDETPSVDNIYIAKEGELGFYDTKGKGDPVYFGAAHYYLPKDIKNYQEYRKLLTRKDGAKFNALKFIVGERPEGSEILGRPIVHVELPKAEQVKMVAEGFEGGESAEVRASRSLSSTMNPEKVNEFFKKFKNLSCDQIYQRPCILFQYAGDGCYARAHYMRKLMADEGYDCEKIFVIAQSEYAPLQASTNAGCCQAWVWHVAPLVKTPYGKLVIDPSICNYRVQIGTWISRMKTSCRGLPTATITQIVKPSYVYRLGYYSDERDDNYKKTYATLEKYSMKWGCE